MVSIFDDDTLKAMVRKNVDTSSVIVTDGHAGYVGLGNEFADHQSVNHSIEEYKRGEWHTNSVEGFFSQLKRSIYGIYHQVSPEHLGAYCTETAYRYNTRKLRDCDRFTNVLSKFKGRLKYKDLIKKK